MTDNKPKITPPPHLMLRWQEEARDEVRDVANHFDRQSIQMIKAANWGWRQRDAYVSSQLQKTRDEELEAVIAWMMKMGFWGGVGEAIPALRAARRPRPKSLAEQKQAIHDEIHQLLAQISANNAGALAVAEPIRRALERLRELEEGQ